MDELDIFGGIARLEPAKNEEGNETKLAGTHGIRVETAGIEEVGVGNLTEADGGPTARRTAEMSGAMKLDRQ